MQYRLIVILFCVLACTYVRGEELPPPVVSIAATDSATVTYEKAVEEEQKVSKGLRFFYRVGDKVDRFMLRGVDTSYIALPEHSWRVAFTTSMVGVNSTITSTTEKYGDVQLLNTTRPSVDLGFNAGYRGFGFGYSWDALNAYARRISFSFGSKSIGLDFSMESSTNINTGLRISGIKFDNLTKNNVMINNTSLSLWYALNSTHYSHQAAVKQSYIQKKTAGSLLLHLAYMSSQVALSDTLRLIDGSEPLLPALMSHVTAIRTRQIAVGIGYGINYTPNKGKVVLHASANALLVAYSVNHISFYLHDSIAEGLPGEPMYSLAPSFPVHVTGNMRAAVSWEINEWVHMNAWATVENIRFKSSITAEDNIIRLDNWDWKVQLSIAVRFGAGKERVDRAMHRERNLRELLYREEDNDANKPHIPLWITDYFWSPHN